MCTSNVSRSQTTSSGGFSRSSRYPKLNVSLAQVVILTLVLPGEVTSFPHIGKTLVALNRETCFSKVKLLPGLVDRSGMRMAEDFAELD